MKPASRITRITKLEAAQAAQEPIPQLRMWMQSEDGLTMTDTFNGETRAFRDFPPEERTRPDQPVTALLFLHPLAPVKP